ncbi:dTDP-4-dehydrorhamnose 3,5-epimerase [Gorillibacterium sp. sgz5001074]|uniref:dTDP-4-dehydrorhamnose 3,5-epimerase n=1 Tax=Gorillibacterium sp. sgz5001074 TaxID=3446695 RepID=UPI003F681B9E
MPIEGVRLIEPKVYGDERGFFLESYKEGDSGQTDFLQDNHSYSREPGTIRGLHYQLEPAAQTKLVRVIAGAIYDVVVDIRTGSPTYGCWQGYILTSRNFRQLLVPKGFAHGFCTLVPDTEVLYKVDAPYRPELDRGIAWNDPALAIDWPFPQPVLSEKDGKHPPLSQAEIHFVWKEAGS